MNGVRVELTKIATHPGSLLAAVSGPVLAGVLIIVTRADDQAAAVATPNPTVVHLCLAAAVALGVTMAGQDHRGGQLGTTLLAVPNRVRLVAARLAAWACCATVAGVAMIGAAHVAAAHRPSRLADLAPVVLSIGVTMAAAALTDATRSPLGAAAAVLSVVWIAPVAAAASPDTARWLPATAIEQLESGNWPDHPTAAALWLAAALLAGALSLGVKDASGE